MNLFKDFRDEILKVVEDLAAEGLIPSGLGVDRVTVEPPRDPSHGDISTNTAMVLAKEAGMNPRDLAALIAGRMSANGSVTEAAVAGPGFINLRLDDRFWLGRLTDVLEAGPAYGDSELGADQTVNVEFVSANPTGPLHVGHGRGAVFGDALATLLAKAGYGVVREYYVNDAGAQVDALARSAHLRYLEALGEEIGEFPEGLYPGEYLKKLGQDLAQRHGGKWRQLPEAEWLGEVRGLAIEAMMALIREDLAALGVCHDVFISERALADGGKVDAALRFLADRDLVYVGTLDPPKGKTIEDWEPRPQTLFRATGFGDDVDRPLKKSDDSWTYFATDIAYHFDKFERGFRSMIDVWGADHSGYVKRMAAAVEAVTEGEGALDVKICQLVNLLDKGDPVKMSKRAGSFVTLAEVVDEVGRDVVRFMMLTRKNDMTLDFDLAHVTEQSKDNPVFYVQYAHARACSALRRAAVEFPDLALDDASLARAGLERLTQPDELALIGLLASWPRQVESAAEAHEPHRLAFYLANLVAAFHALWNKGNEDLGLRFIVEGEPGLTQARLALVRGVATVIASGLAVIGVVPLKEMR